MIRQFFKHRDSARGQSMLIAVITLTGAILGVALVIGFLLVLQLRQSTNLANVERAALAADAGAEWYLATKPPHSSSQSFNLSNGSSYTLETKNDLEAKIIGRSGRSRKVVTVSLANAGVPPPDDEIPCDATDIGFVIDTSQSMAASFANVQAAAISLVDVVSNQAQIGLVTFDETSIRVRDKTSDFNDIRNAINSLTLHPDDDTALSFGISEAGDLLRPLDFMVIFTDGDVNFATFPPHTEVRARTDAENSATFTKLQGITVFVVAISADGVGPAGESTDAEFLATRIASSPTTHYIDGTTSPWPSWESDVQNISACPPLPVVNCAANRAPTCQIPVSQNISVCPNTEFCFPIDASDPDGNLSSCSKLSGPGVVRPAAGGGWEWCYSTSQDSDVDVKISCVDDCSATCQSAFRNYDFTIRQSGCADPPPGVLTCDDDNIDLMLLIDRPFSDENSILTALKNGLAAFINRLSFGSPAKSQVGLIGVTDRAPGVYQLTGTKTRVEGYINNLKLHTISRDLSLNLAINPPAALRELSSSRDRDDSSFKDFILITVEGDSRPINQNDSLGAANAAKQSGIAIYVVAIDVTNAAHLSFYENISSNFDSSGNRMRSGYFFQVSSYSDLGNVLTRNVLGCP